MTRYSAMSPDFYWASDQPDHDSILNDANEVLDTLVAEWSESAVGGEFEVSGYVQLDLQWAPHWTITRVAQDGRVLYGGPSGEFVEFDHDYEVREWLEENFPLRTPPGDQE